MPKRGWTQPPDEQVEAWIKELRQRVHSLATEIGKRQLEIRRLQQQARQREAEVTQVLSHTVIVVALIAAAVTLTVTGNDSTPAWAALGGYIVGGSVQKATVAKDRP